MKIVDPLSLFGSFDSGLRTLVVNKQERACLLRAVAILERGHDLVTAFDENHQGQNDELGEALCLGPSAIRELATEGLSVA